MTSDEIEDFARATWEAMVGPEVAAANPPRPHGWLKNIQPFTDEDRAKTLS